MAKEKLHRPRRIAPRLADGSHRDPLAHGIPPHIKEAIRMRAYAENKSMSWLLEEALIDHFRYKRPEYIPAKQQTPEETARARGTLQREGGTVRRKEAADAQTRGH